MVEQSKLVLSKQWFIDSHQGNIKDVYHFVERLGSGGFGVVYLAEHRVTSKKLSAFYSCLEHKYAVKAIQKSRVRDYETF
jgi:serine/threonine protein kinase